MARPYRKVAQAVEDLRKCAGILAAVSSADVSSAYQAIGRLDVLIPKILDDLQADRIVEPSEAFVDGYDSVARLSQPLPFPEACDGC